MGTNPVCDSCRMPPPLYAFIQKYILSLVKVRCESPAGIELPPHHFYFYFYVQNSLEKKVVIREDMVRLCLSIRLYYKPNDCGKRHQLINVMVNMMFDNKTKMEINLIINLSCMYQVTIICVP